MKKEYKDQEVEELVIAVEEKYEQILRDDLVNKFFRFRVRSYYTAFAKLKGKGLRCFDKNGMISTASLVGLDDGYDHGWLQDEFHTCYFLPVMMPQMLDGEEVIKRLVYYYTGKKKSWRVILMQKLLSDYRTKFRRPSETRQNNLPGRSSDAPDPKSVLTA